MSLAPRLITVSCFGTLVRRNGSRGNQYRKALLESLPHGMEVPSAAALSSSYKKAFREQSAAAPNFGKGKVGSPRIWWNAVLRDTVIGAGAPSLASIPAFDDVCNKLYDNLHEQWEPFPTTSFALSNLRSWCDHHDCQLGVVANMDDRLPHFLSELGLAEHFDFIQSSYECGFEQPAPHIYFNAVHHASIPPSLFAYGKPPPALHCGHLALDDLHGALGAGFAACLVHTKFETLSPLKQMITEWQTAANIATRAWHSPHLGLAQQLLVE
jgi:FMN phosphatase YigB (HAD superfamily)